MEAEIPTDVMDAANVEAGRWFRSIGSSEYHFSVAVARAIVAERERCALIAERQAADYKRHGSDHHASAATGIANSIRKGA